MSEDEIYQTKLEAVKAMKNPVLFMHPDNKIHLPKSTTYEVRFTSLLEVDEIIFMDRSSLFQIDLNDISCQP